jgi:PST family polysaccharide transporter
MSAVANARWVGTIQAARVGTQLLSLLVLSRLLTPADFGLVAIVFAVSNFAMLIRDLGTATAIIQKAVLEPQTTLTAHWSNCFIGIALAALLAVLAVPMAMAFQTAALAPLLQLTAVSFPFLGSSTVHQALLERNSRFAVMARIEISAVLCGFIVAVTTAWLGAGAYSLVLQTLTVAIVSAVQLWIASGLRWTWNWSREHARQLWQFSGGVLGFNLVNYFARNADTMIIGRVLGASSLGPYSLAYRIMLFPLQNLTFVATRALLPVMSRSQHAPAEIGAMYLRLLSVIAFFTAPLMAGLFVLREPFVTVAFGDSWQMVGVIIAWLAPVGFMQSLVSVGGTVFTALGRTEVLFRLGLFSTAVHVAAFIAGVNWGVTGVAAAYFIVTLINAAVCFGVLLRLLHQPFGALVGALLPAFVRAVLMALAIHFAQLELARLSLSPVLLLSTLGLGGCALYLLLTRLHLRPGDLDVLRLFLKRA